MFHHFTIFSQFLYLSWFFFFFFFNAFLHTVPVPHFFPQKSRQFLAPEAPGGRAGRSGRRAQGAATQGVWRHGDFWTKNMTVLRDHKKTCKQKQPIDLDGSTHDIPWHTQNNI